jgi:hypothetical protein
LAPPLPLGVGLWRPAKEPSDGSLGSEGGDACKAGKATYHDRRAALLKQAETTTCSVDADCGILNESNRCVVTCGTPLPAAAVSEIQPKLDPLATEQCGTCPPLPIPPCAPPGPLTCQQGQCVN